MHQNPAEGSGASGDFRVFRASISTDVSSSAPSQTLAFPAIPQATTDGAAVSQLRKMTQLPQMHQNQAVSPIVIRFTIARFNPVPATAPSLSVLLRWERLNILLISVSRMPRPCRQSSIERIDLRQSG